MAKSVETTGKTVDEAVNNGLEELGCSLDQVTIEVLDEGESGILKFNRRPARVRLILENAEDLAPGATVPDSEQYDFSQPGLAAMEAEDPGMLTDTEFTDGLETLVEAESQEPVAAKTTEPVYYGDASDYLDDQTDEYAEEAVAFVREILQFMDIDAQVTFTRDDDHINVDIEGGDIGAVIGRRGDTLNALQYLLGLTLNRKSEKHLYITLDAAGYRRRREDSLTDLARRCAAKVVKVRKDFVMEPMTSAERRIIHTALQDYPGVSTESEGEEPNRCVVIIPTDKD
ncbi:protein jag [Oscillospiraceae bacterium HV4-5-C5C]|nr:protein jag [Oscillospiraceae bacterium HV4-5-C5C]